MSKRIVRQLNVVLDEVYTPKEAIFSLVPFIQKNWIIWECASGKGMLAQHLREEGYSVVLGENFFSDNFQADCIITNPPYSLKDEFLERAYSINKPFAFLLPLTALEGKFRGSLYRKHGIQLIIPNGRIHFIIPSGKKSAWFQTAWFTFRLNLPRDLMFVDKLRGEKESLTQEKG